MNCCEMTNTHTNLHRKYNYMQVVETAVQCELFNLEEVAREVGRAGVVELFSSFSARLSSYCIMIKSEFHFRAKARHIN